MSNDEAEWIETRDNFAASCAKLSRALMARRLTITITVDEFGCTAIEVNYSTYKEQQ